VSQYYFLQDASIGQNYYTAGSTASTADVGGTLPLNFQPNGSAMCPLDSSAITAFYNSRPPLPPGQARQQFTGVPVAVQGVYWQMTPTTSGNRWNLVGTNLPSFYY
jgi:hypothetical protein